MKEQTSKEKLDELERELTKYQPSTPEYNKILLEIYKAAIANGEPIFGSTHYKYCRSEWCGCSA